MTLLSKSPWEPCFNARRRAISYRATFWDGEAKRHYDRDCDDVLYDKKGRLTFLNTSPSVSYYSQLLKSAS